MKFRKAIALMMALMTALSGAAFAENIIFLPKLDEGMNMPENIPEEYNPEFIQRYNDILYFVDAQPVEDGNYGDSIHTLYAMDVSGNITQIGESLKYAREYEYSDEDYTYLTSLTQYNGYSDMTVYEDHIYYIGTDDTAGSYTTYSTYWEPGEVTEFTSTYAGTACVYRMDLDGGNLVKLISGLGNGPAHMDIANGRIAVSSCYLNNFYVYDFVDFMFYDLQGNYISGYETPIDTDAAAYMYEAQHNLLVDGILTDGKDIYASLSDSEGDFASSRLVKLPDLENELLLEAYFVRSAMADNGAIAYFTSDADDVFWDEYMADSLTLRVYENGENRVLARVPAMYGEGWNQQLTIIGEEIYFIGENAMLRVSLNSGGDVWKYENGAFIHAPECNPEYYVPGGSVAVIGSADGPTAIYIAESNDGEEEFYYLPDSNTRAYTKDELQQYDAETLGFMRNEILARHGYPFKKEAYRNHFESMPWYTRNENFEYGMLNAIEMENVEIIKAVEASK